MVSVNRAGKKQKWEMTNDNTTWIEPATLRNIEKIYDFLLEKTKVAQKFGRHKPKYSYSQLAKQTGINPKQVQFACQKLAFKIIPYLKITAISYGTKTGAKTTEKVEAMKLD